MLYGEEVSVTMGKNGMEIIPVKESFECSVLRKDYENLKLLLNFNHIPLEFKESIANITSSVEWNAKNRGCELLLGNA